MAFARVSFGEAAALPRHTAARRWRRGARHGGALYRSPVRSAGVSAL